MNVTTTIEITRREVDFTLDIEATVDGDYTGASWTNAAEGGEILEMVVRYNGRTYTRLTKAELQRAEDAIHEVAGDLRWGSDGDGY